MLAQRNFRFAVCNAAPKARFGISPSWREPNPISAVCFPNQFFLGFGAHAVCIGFAVRARLAL